MVKDLFTRFCYELYKLDWKKNHNITISDESALIRRFYKKLKEGYPYGLEDYTLEFGYNGVIYASEEEFLSNEFLDEDYMRGLLSNSSLYVEYSEVKERLNIG